MSPMPLHLRDFISPSPSPSSPRSTSFTSNPSLPWIIIGIVVGLTFLATSTTIIIIYYNRRQQRQKQNNPNHTTPSQSQLITPSTTQLQQQKQQQQRQQEQPSSSTLTSFLRRKSSTSAASQFEQEELQRASMIRKSYASRSWNSLSLDSSQMSLSLSQLSPTRTVGSSTLRTSTLYGSSSRVNTLERVNTTTDFSSGARNNTYNNEEDLEMEMETPTTPTELRGTTATEDGGGREAATSRLKDDWKAWEARVKLERSVSGELHPVYTAAAAAAAAPGTGTETETEAGIYGTRTEGGGVARTAKAVEVPIPPRHPGRIASPTVPNMV